MEPNDLNDALIRRRKSGSIFQKVPHEASSDSVFKFKLLMVVVPPSNVDKI